MKPRGIFTLVIVASAVAGSFLLRDQPQWWNNATTWLIHADARHMICDIGAFALLSFWLEQRIGTMRLVLWMISAVLVSSIAHKLFYPMQQSLFGLSAACWTMAGAAAAAFASRRSPAPGLAALATMTCILATEMIPPARAIMLAISGGDASRPLMIGTTTLKPVPLVHLIAAVNGLLLGLATRRITSRPDGSASPASSRHRAERFPAAAGAAPCSAP